MRVAYWTPLPPSASGIADNSYELLTELARLVSVTAVVRDEVVETARAPHGVDVIAAKDYDPSHFDSDVYEMGNHYRFHRYIHERALARPGILVLHDPSLVDFFGAICGGLDTGTFFEEARYTDPSLEELPMLSIRGEEEVDRARLPMSKRLVDSSLLTVVHSEWAAEEIRQRSPGARVTCLPLTTPVLSRPADEPREPGAPTRFGVFGSISPHKQVDTALAAFIAVHQSNPSTRLVIAGYRDDLEFESELRATVRDEGLDDVVSFHCDVELAELEALVLDCDCVISLRWPTAGETSAILMRALGAGRVVVTTDLPQYRELADEYCRKVPHEPDRQQSRLVAEMRAIAADPLATAAAGEQAAEFVLSKASPAVVAERYLELLSSVARLRQQRAAGEPEDSEPTPVGVNAIASWASTTGLTEAARRAVGALLDVGADISIEDIDFGSPREQHRFPARLRALPTGRNAPIDLCFLNVNELQVLSDDELHPPGTSSYVIGYWYWELPSIPSQIAAQLRRVDEIWVASQFVADSFRQYTAAPVHVMPSVVEPERDPNVGRAEFDLPDDTCLFLFQFDANSTLARKNPLGTIRAFQQAFDRSERGSKAVLIVKTINLEKLPEASATVRQALRSVSGVLIDTDLSAKSMASLVACCDVYVSLHRAEGFGLGMAEAMYFSRPVIATAYSGNEDFCTITNSLQVGYDIAEVSDTDLRFNPAAEFIYVPGSLWAEPDIDQAARWMRLLYEEPELRRRFGEAGATTIRARYSAEAAGTAMAARLREISPERVAGYR